MTIKTTVVVFFISKLKFGANKIRTKTFKQHSTNPNTLFV